MSGFTDRTLPENIRAGRMIRGSMTDMLGFALWIFAFSRDVSPVLAIAALIVTMSISAFLGLMLTIARGRLKAKLDDEARQP